MSEVVLQDQEIIDLTTQVNNGEYTQFKITLPGSNRVVTSENMRKSDIKGGTLIDWCEAIRGQMKADYTALRDEMEEKRKARIDEEEKARLEVLEQSEGQSGAEGVLLPAIEGEFVNENDEPQLIIPVETIKKSTSANAEAHKANLWQTYGNLLGEVEKVKAQLRAMGEQV